MFSLQSMGIKILGVLALSGLLAYGYYHMYQVAYQSGFKSEKLIRDNVDLVNNQKAQDALLAKDKDKEQLQVTFDDQVSTIQSQLSQEKLDHEKTKSDLLAAIHNNSVRLQFNTSTKPITTLNCKSCSDIPDTTGIVTGSTTAVMPEVANAIITSADENRQLLQNYSALINLYNDARNTCNKSQ